MHTPGMIGSDARPATLSLLFASLRAAALSWPLGLTSLPLARISLLSALCMLGTDGMTRFLLRCTGEGGGGG
jgi:hypothetical protein